MLVLYSPEDSAARPLTYSCSAVVIEKHTNVKAVVGALMDIMA